MKRYHLRIDTFARYSIGYKSIATYLIPKVLGIARKVSSKYLLVSILTHICQYFLGLEAKKKGSKYRVPSIICIK